MYVRTPRRADALLFTVAVATLISSIIDALLRRSGSCPFPTVRKAAEAIQHVMFEIYRDTSQVTVARLEGSADRVFAYIDEIGVNPSVLLDK